MESGGSSAYSNLNTAYNKYQNCSSSIDTTTTFNSVSNFHNLVFNNEILNTSSNTSIAHDSDGMPSFDQREDNVFFSLRYSNSIIRLCLAVFGVLANSVTCYVLTYKKLWSPTTLLLMTLVIYDAMFLLASIPLSLVDAFIKVDMETFAIICGIFYPIRYMAQTGSIYTLGTLTIERYLIVLRPFKARSFCSFGKIKRFIIVIFVFAIIFNIPRCFFYSLMTSYKQWSTNMTSFQNTTTTQDWNEAASTSAAPKDMAALINEEQQQLKVANDDDRVMESFVQSESAKRQEFYVWLYMRVYELYTSSVFLYLLPYALIPVLNMQLLLAIKQRRNETRTISLRDQHKLEKTRATNREDGLTMIVLGITVSFFICCLIPAIYNVTQMAQVSANSHFSFYLLIASDTMLCVNASTDFFFYCLLGAKFRHTFLHICCKKI